MAGYGSSYPLFVQYPERPEYLLPNQEIARRYFRDRTITPVAQLDFFRAEKEPGTFRIVFQGESSAAGFPYRHGGAPSRMLEQRLQATFPDRRIEVINTALTAINSYTLLDLADEIIDQRPDAVMIYTGHNEYYGVFGVASTQSVGRSRALIRAYLALRRLRIAQLLGNALSAAAGALDRKPAGESASTVMEMLAGEQRVALGSTLYEQGLEQFRGNLDELLARYRSHGIPVLIGTVASNERDQRPFVSDVAPGTDSAAWRRRYQTGIAALQQGDTAAAERELQALVAADSSAADAWYALGRLSDARGDTVRARASYRAAKERDQLRFRAPEAINRIIREEAARHGATVVETQQALERAAPGGVVGRTLMLEHVHPNIDGYFLIADAFYEALRQKRMVGPWTAAVPAAQARHDVPVTAVDSLAGLYRVDRLLSGFPFQPAGTRLTPVSDTLRPRTLVERLALGLVHGTIAWPIAMDTLRMHYERAGEYEPAMRVARAMAQEYRYAAAPYIDAGRIALAQGRDEEALRWVREAHRRRETASSARLLGLLSLRQGDHAAATTWLRRAVQLAPRDRQMQLVLSAAHAIPRLEQDRARRANDLELLLELAAVYAITEQYERSREALEAIFRIDPDHPGGRALEAKLPPQPQ